MLPDETQEPEPEKTGTAIEKPIVPANGPNTNGLGVVMETKTPVVMQTDGNWTYEDRISGFNINTRTEEWLQITPADPAELIGGIGEMARGSDEYCSGVDELIHYRGQLYLVQNIDIDEGE